MNRFIENSTVMPPYLQYPRALLKLGLRPTETAAYLLLLDRARLSFTHARWRDGQGRVFLVYPVRELAADLERSVTAVKSALAALESRDLILRVRRGQGKPSLIYVKLPDADTCAPSARESGGPCPQEVNEACSQKVNAACPQEVNEACPQEVNEACPQKAAKPTPNNNYREKTTESESRSQKGGLPGLGWFGNVFLSETELAELRLRTTEAELADMIDGLSFFVHMDPGRCPDHAASLREMIRAADRAEDWLPGWS